MFTEHYHVPGTAINVLHELFYLKLKNLSMAGATAIVHI